LNPISQIECDILDIIASRDRGFDIKEIWRIGATRYSFSDRQAFVDAFETLRMLGYIKSGWYHTGLCEKSNVPAILTDRGVEALQSAGKRDVDIPESPWMPISTAPLDGTYVLLRGPSGYSTTPYRVSVGAWIADFRDDWVNHANDRFTDGGSRPTHWMPLPQ